MRRLLLVLAVALLGVGGDARAQGTGSPEALAAAKKRASILSADTVNQLSQAMLGQIWPKLQAEFSKKVDQATIQEMRAEFEKIMGRFLADTMKDAPSIYARHFTAQELRDITAFYRTPTGQKALRTMPVVAAESFGMIMPRMKDFQRELDDALQGVLKRRGYQK